MNYIANYTLLILLIALNGTINSKEETSQLSYKPGLAYDYGYPQFCLLASENDNLFSNFRASSEFRGVVENVSIKQALFLEQYIMAHYSNLSIFFEKIVRDDLFGKPLQHSFKAVGLCSPATIRYLKIAGDLISEFGHLHDYNIAEIGGGFGGQCKMIHDVSGFKSYDLIDLPECLGLIKKYLGYFLIPNVGVIDGHNNIDDFNYDLIISNYAIGEMDREYQEHYIGNILNKSKYGYIIYNFNFIPKTNVHPYSLEEFINLISVPGRVLKIEELSDIGTHKITWKNKL